MVDTVKSLSLTNLDTIPVFINTAAQGAPNLSRDVSDFAAATVAGLGSTSSTYKMVRLPSDATLKSITVFTGAALETSGSPTLSIDVGAYYSDSTVDGTAVANQGSLISANCFAAAELFGASTTLSVNGALNMNANLINQPLWKQAGLTADPGGAIDIVIAVHAAVTTGALGNIGLRCSFGF